MAQSNIGKRQRRQGIFIKGQVLRIPSMEHQDPGPPGGGHRKSGGPVLGDLCRMVAEAVNLRVQVLKIHRGHGIVHQKRYIGAPGKAQKR